MGGADADLAIGRGEAFRVAGVRGLCAGALALLAVLTEGDCAHVTLVLLIARVAPFGPRGEVAVERVAGSAFMCM